MKRVQSSVIHCLFYVLDGGNNALLAVVVRWAAAACTYRWQQW
jgi:hypothetical protein